VKTEGLEYLLRKNIMLLCKDVALVNLSSLFDLYLANRAK
jgi:hypothetical protein